jgi:hypothetical protein
VQHLGLARREVEQRGDGATRASDAPALEQEREAEEPTDGRGFQPIAEGRAPTIASAMSRCMSGRSPRTAASALGSSGSSPAAAESA